MKRKTKRLVLILLPVVLIIVALGIWGPKLYLKMMEKQIDKISVEQTTIKKDTVDMKVRVDVSEKQIPILIDSMYYRTEIYNTVVSEGTKKFDPDERKNVSMVFPVSVNYELLKEHVKGHQGDSTEITMFIRHFLNFPLLGTRTVDVVKKVHMRLPIIPEVRIKDVEMLDFGLDNMKMMVTLSIDNPNNIDFTIKSMKHSVQVKDYATSYGNLEKDYHIKRFDVTEIQVPVTTDMKNELKAFWKTIKGDTEWPYYLRTQMVLKPSDSKIDDIEMESEKQGKVDVKEALKAMKNKERIKVDEKS